MLQSLDGRSIRVDEAGKGSRRPSGGQYAGRGGGRFGGGGGRGRGELGHFRGGKASRGVQFWDLSLIPLLAFAIAILFMQVDMTGAMGTGDMTEGVAGATGETGATADTEVEAAAAVAAAADTLVATEILGKGQSLILSFVCCALLF